MLKIKIAPLEITSYGITCVLAISKLSVRLYPKFNERYAAFNES